MKSLIKAALVGGIVAVVVVSLPDIKRYIQISTM